MFLETKIAANCERSNALKTRTKNGIGTSTGQKFVRGFTQQNQLENDNYVFADANETNLHRPCKGLDLTHLSSYTPRVTEVAIHV